MTTITAGMVKELRDKTGAGMMDCKTALTEVKGNLEEAIDWLRKKGLSKAAKKADRIAADGLIGVTASGATGALVEVNSETDFVARNDQFQGLVPKYLEQSLANFGAQQEQVRQAMAQTVQSTMQNTMGGFLPWGISMAAISSLNRPAAMAASAFCWEAAAKASCSSRVRP